MKFNRLGWLILFLLFLFFLGLFYIEVSVYSVLPPELGGMSFWTELKNVWYRSVSFYAMVMIVSFFLYVRIIHK
ncbi:hypothetical protein LC048_20240 [Mesobacillus subterraneus]|uniref:hypothetical protein n=1 Tax=Mesobacillus subterraneus TaxID=285983 RepID=UPI001CFE495C|nr:hypothetical protein [Mesobacillus subterraneus]WLR54711.1 hypothetical protein LC048_20240 [Mesobacillus subterraneus]